MKFDDLCKVIFNETNETLRKIRKYKSSRILDEMARAPATLIADPEADTTILKKKNQPEEYLNNAERIFNFIAENPGTTIRDVANKFDVKFQVARHYVRQLESKGLVSSQAPEVKPKPEKKAPARKRQARKTPETQKYDITTLQVINDTVRTEFEFADKPVLSYDEIKVAVQEVQDEYFDEGALKVALDWMIEQGELEKVGEDKYRHIGVAADQDVDIDPDKAEPVIGDADWLGDGPDLDEDW